MYDPFSQGTSSNTDPRSMGTNPSEGNFTSWSQAYNSTGHQHQQQHHHHSTALLSPTLFPHIQVFLLVHTILTSKNRNFFYYDLWIIIILQFIHMVAVRTLEWSTCHLCPRLVGLGVAHLRMHFLCWAFDLNIKTKMIKLAEAGSFYLFLILNR